MKQIKVDLRIVGVKNPDKVLTIVYTPKQTQTLIAGQEYEFVIDLEEKDESIKTA